MIRKLRIKFIAATMCSLFAVLAVILAAAAILNYREAVDTADSTLAVLMANDGDFPDSDMWWYSYRGLKRGSKTLAELPYESRYFMVAIGGDGTVAFTDVGKIAAVDISTAAEYALTVWEGGKSEGFLGVYRYVAYTADSETHIIFLDCSSSLATFRTFVVTSAAVSLAGFLGVLLLMIILSGRIVKPFSENYEKQKQFITDAGHELKTPLTIIDADAEILEMDFGENEWLRDIQNQTKRLTDLTNDLIVLSRMEEERTRAAMIEFPLSDVVEETAASFRTVARTQGKNLDSHIEPMISMKGDERAIRQLVTILLDNAVKYSEEGGSISLTLEKQKMGVRLSVYNTAEYVSKKQLSHLFDRFYRTDESRNSQVGGYGLGLAMASAVVNAHRGKITASTEDEKSLQVTAVFPG